MLGRLYREVETELGTDLEDSSQRDVEVLSQVLECLVKVSFTHLQYSMQTNEKQGASPNKCPPAPPGLSAAHLRRIQGGESFHESKNLLAVQEFAELESRRQKVEVKM